MVSDLPLVDQVWMFSAVFAVIVGCLAILVLLGPEYVRDVVAAFTRSSDDDGPGPTDPAVAFRQTDPDFRNMQPGDVYFVPANFEQLRIDALKRDAEIQELQ